MKCRFLALLLIITAVLTLSTPLCSMQNLDGNNKMEKGEVEKKDLPIENEKQEKEKGAELRRRALERFAAAQKKHQKQNAILSQNSSKGSGKEQIKTVVKEIFENVQKRNEACCPICQEPLTGKRCTTIHKGGGAIPHTFHTWCLYNWCKQTEGAAELLNDPEEGSKSDKKIAIACPLCHEQDTTQNPLPKMHNGDKKEKPQYPPKKFDLSIAELCKGAIENVEEIPLKERFENIEDLPTYTIISTLQELAKMTSQEREKIYTENKKNDLKIQRITLRIICEIAARANTISPTAQNKIASLLNTALSLLGDRPLSKEFAEETKHLDDKQMVSCFERAFDCQDLLCEDALSKLRDFEACAEERFGLDENIDNEDNADDKKEIAEKEVMQTLDCYMSIKLYHQCYEKLSSEQQNYFFGKLLTKEARKPELKWNLLGTVLQELNENIQLAYFDTIYPHIDSASKIDLLIELGKKLIKKKGLEAASLLVKNMMDDEKVSLEDKRTLLGVWWDTYAKNMASLPEKFKILEFLPKNIMLDTIKEISLLSPEQREKTLGGTEAVALKIQRAIPLLEGNIYADNVLKLLENAAIYREFLPVIFKNIPENQRSAYFKKALENDKPFYTDNEWRTMAHTGGAQDAQIVHYTVLANLFDECLPHLSAAEQVDYLNIFLDTKAPDREVQTETIGRLSKLLAPAALVAHFDTIYPSLSANEKIALLIRCKKELLEKIGKKTITWLLDQIENDELSAESIDELINTYWDELSNEYRRITFSAFLSIHHATKEKWGYVAATVRTILEKLNEDEFPTYGTIINNRISLNLDYTLAILDGVSQTSTLQGKKAFYKLYDYIQKNIRNPNRDLVRKTILARYWHLLSKRQRLISAAPLLNTAAGKSILKELKNPIPLDLVKKLLATEEITEQLKILKSDWSQIKPEFHIGGLKMAIALIRTKTENIFEATGLKSWLPTCSYKEKTSLLRLLWEDEKNRLAYFNVVYDCCDAKEKALLKKRYDKKVAKTTKVFSFAANLLTNKMPSFLDTKNGKFISENILRDAPSKTTLFTNSFGMGNAITAGKNAVLGLLSFGKKTKK